MGNGRKIKDESAAECSPWSILQYFRPALSYHLSFRLLFCLFVSSRQVLLQYEDSETCLKRPLQRRQNIGFQDRLSLNVGQKYCRMLQESILQYFGPSLSYHFLLEFLLECKGTIEPEMVHHPYPTITFSTMLSGSRCQTLNNKPGLFIYYHIYMLNI